ncbi:response regulator [Luteibacter sp. 3190]|uniref:hybrid sensor histidine kinase/response regulator n=1 Tax=Luteibacter sp. 3190 TaxID=2817736 RepID=UPI0028651723|nr:response regulator [Luteibacter sp. 3190]MDR6936088.1 PAS domain S-box-containing protein [Luteibacter sp. 3190]
MSEPPRSDPFAFLPVDSPTAGEIRAFPWSGTPLGAVEGWPAALRSMLATMMDTPQPMFISVEPGQLFFFNDPYRPILGHRLHGAIGRRFDELWGDVWDAVSEHVDAAMAGRGTMHRDLPLTMTRYGFPEDTWWTFSYAPLRDEEGRIFGMVAVTNETTRGVRSAVALRELNASLEREIDARTRERDQLWAISRDLYVVMGRDGHYRNVNPAWANELGHDLADVVGTGFEELVHPDDLARATDAVSQLLDGDVVEDLEVRIRAHDGSYRWFAWTCVPDGDVVYGMGRDVERRREMEDQWRHAQKLEALGRLTGGIAHDFNNILGGIGGAIEVVSERLASGRADNVQRMLDAAAGAVKRAAGLTHRLLAYSRQQALSLSDVDANQIVRGLDLLLRPVLGEQVSIVLRTQSDLWRTLSDASQLESAILNLAINARDAMPQGGQLGIVTRNAPCTDIGDGAADYVVVSVTDTGTGMSRATAEKAFDPFFTTKAIGQGTGLGLSMVDGFARQTGGRAIIDSVPGAGTTVSLWLPRHLGEASVAHTHDVERQDGSGRRVLLVEDEQMLRSIACEVLEESGYEVDACADASEALGKLHAGRTPDILVTDIGLPGMDGHQFARAMREMHPRVPVLYITGYAWDAFAETPHLPERAALLSKPFSLQALTGSIAELLRTAS